MERLKEHHVFINLFWNHIKKHIDTDVRHGSESEVEIFTADTEAISLHYKDNPAMQKFVKACLIAFATYLEDTNGNKTM